jgi:hypothetical protein
MATLHELMTEAGTYQAYLEINFSDDPDELSERISTLSVYMARTGFMLAEAKLLLNRKVCSEIGETIIKIAKENYLSAKAQNALVSSISSEERYLVDWLDRLNASCTHQADNCRSLLSFQREQLRVTKTGY